MINYQSSKQRFAPLGSPNVSQYATCFTTCFTTCLEKFLAVIHTESRDMFVSRYVCVYSPDLDGNRGITKMCPGRPTKGPRYMFHDMFVSRYVCSLVRPQTLDFGTLRNTSRFLHFTICSLHCNRINNASKNPRTSIFGIQEFRRGSTAKRERGRGGLSSNPPEETRGNSSQTAAYSRIQLL
jgi:hypothetical protein